MARHPGIARPSRHPSGTSPVWWRQPAASRAWTFGFESVWLVGAAALTGFIALRWPRHAAALPQDEAIARMAVCGLFVFAMLTVRHGYYLHRNLKAVAITALLSAYQAVMLANAAGVAGIAVLRTATAAFVVTMIYVMSRPLREGAP